MSITTNQRLNIDQVVSAMPAGSTFTGGDQNTMPTTATKVLTPVGATDAQLQTAVNTAAAVFVDRSANQTTITTNLINAQTTIQNWITANPSGAVLTAAQTLVVAKMLNGIVKLLLVQYDSTSGT